MTLCHRFICLDGHDCGAAFEDNESPVRHQDSSRRSRIGIAPVMYASTKYAIRNTNETAVSKLTVHWQLPY